MALPTNVTTPRARASYPNLFKPKKNELNDKEEYSVQAIFEVDAKHPDFAPMVKAFENACINKWGADKAAWPKKIRSPFKLQDELIERAKAKKQDFEHLKEGAVYMTFKTAATKKDGTPNPRPQVVGKDRQPIEEPSKFYAGCWAKFAVSAKAYLQLGNSGVSFYLNASQFVGDAPAFGGRPNAESAFESIPEDDEIGGQSADEMFK